MTYKNYIEIMTKNYKCMNSKSFHGLQMSNLNNDNDNDNDNEKDFIKHKDSL